MEVQIVSGFYGAGKTTFLNYYMPMLDGKNVVIQNELGEAKLEIAEVGDIPVEEMTSGCICCTQALAFQDGIKKIMKQYHPNRILIEPSGLGYLHDIVKACMKVRDQEKVDLQVTKLITLVNLADLEECLDGLGFVYKEQIQRARLILVSGIEGMGREERERKIELVRELNPWATIYEGDYRKLDPEVFLQLMDTISDYEEEPKEYDVSYLPSQRCVSGRKFQF